MKIGYLLTDPNSRSPSKRSRPPSPGPAIQPPLTGFPLSSDGHRYQQLPPPSSFRHGYLPPPSALVLSSPSHCLPNYPPASFSAGRPTPYHEPAPLARPTSQANQGLSLYPYRSQPAPHYHTQAPAGLPSHRRPDYPSQIGGSGNPYQHVVDTGQVSSSSHALPRHSSNGRRGQRKPSSRAKWDSSDDILLDDAYKQGMKWEDIANLFPDRTPLACRLRYQNYVEGRKWSKEDNRRLAQGYIRLRKTMFLPLAQELNLPWRKVESRLFEIDLGQVAHDAEIPLADLIPDFDGDDGAPDGYNHAIV